MKSHIWQVVKRLSTAGVVAGLFGVTPRAEPVCTLAAPMAVVAIDGIASLSSQSSKEFLVERPFGAYTTARTCSRARRIFEWETHVHRTASSAAAMISDSSSPTAPDPAYQQSLLTELGTAAALRPRLESTVSAAVRTYCATFGQSNELKVTLLVTWPPANSVVEDADFCSRGSIACHVQPLPPLPQPPIRVEVRGEPRSNAAAKSSSWVVNRAPLEALKRADINELLLATEMGELLEGSQSNVRHACVSRFSETEETC